ncbi:Mce family protein [Gordonia hirsuta DSM 44140 = NBRC 16056]|uniref:Mce family protein n=1 Tax=Gordonia hirsuta DSM 44140 = NBRC 16056 TaxID=1121927 RepID=L7L9R5_9ACTN|nr:MCE family protein [Gordonia hirsuta]GAC57885.1 Mce family protein [Gordonia hirsuta DSM 44140 = NBRC 16056]
MTDDDPGSTPEPTAPEIPEAPRREGPRSRVSMGLIGATLTTMVVLIALMIDKVPYISQVSNYEAYFEDAGGLVVGDVVTVAGVHVGAVTAIGLAQTDDGMTARVRFRLNDTIELGDRSRAAIKTETVLGRRNLTIMPLGQNRIRSGGAIPLDQTKAPYSLSDALEDSVSTLTKTDTEQLNTALETLSEAFADTPPQMRGAVEGVGRLSAAVAARDNSLNDLLSRAKGVTDIVGQRSDQLQKLLLDANALLGELQARRTAIREIITGTKNLSAELTGFVKDNQEQLTPVLTKFNRVLDILNDNADNFTAAIDNLGPYANILGEAVSSGPYFSSLVGLPTWGDYMGSFMRVLEQKYPEAAEYFTKYSGFPLWPGNWSQAPDRGSPDLSRPAPSSKPPQPPVRTSTAPTRKPAQTGGR